MIDQSLLQQTYTNSFSIIRLLDNKLYSNKCSIKLDLNMLNQESSTTAERTTAIKQMDYWINNILDQSIFYHVVDEIDTGMFSHLDNNIIFSPGETHDHVLMLLLHCKLNAIGQGHVSVSQIEFLSDMNKTLVHRFSGDSAAKFPSNQEWVGPVGFFDQPWWLRSDGSTMDVILEPGEDRHCKPDILIDLDLVNQQQLHTAEIIKPNFKVIQ